jgi:hypothetical protein
MLLAGVSRSRVRVTHSSCRKSRERNVAVTCALRARITVNRFELAFLALVGAQAAHSFEEYVGRLYDVFPPARAVSGLISQDRARGFVIFNLALVGFGLWCFLFPVRRRWRSAVPLAQFWVAIELVNGIGHPLWSVIQLGYTPGVATAPVLLVLALYLARQLRAGQSSARG